ncbi:MAG: two-component system sensor histidine kinase CreC [Gammaproteobacteria bacterium]
MSIRTRIFIIFAATVVAGFGWLSWWITGDLRNRYSESFEEVLVDSANLLAEQLAISWPLPPDMRFRSLQAAMQRLGRRQLSAQIYSVEKTSADIRVYVTDNRGRLLFHSQPGHQPGEDFFDWRDVALTLVGQYGARTTDEVIKQPDGSTVPVSVAYVAAPIVVDGRRVGVVSIGKPKTNIERFIISARRQFITVALLTGGVAITFALLLYVWMTRPLQSLVDYANRVSRGERVVLPAMGNNEIGRVGKAMESMRQALDNNAYIEAYVQSLTHEVKSPLTAIRASAELLAGDLAPTQRQSFSAAIEREVDRLNDIADRLLELASLERIGVLEHAERVALFELADLTAATAREAGAMRNIRVATDFSGDDALHGDALLLRQAIDNLVRNALDFSPEGGTVTITGTADAGKVKLAITDEGPGIPPYAQAHIFDRFYSLTRPHNGRKSTGLGLNFVRQVAQLHGGAISIDRSDTDSPGTRATLTLPRHNVGALPLRRL